MRYIELQQRRGLALPLLGFLLLIAPTARAQEAPESSPPSPQAPESDPIPVMFPHPETDRLWISGQANFISQWHPAFHSPYQGRNSLSPEAQDASSRVLTLYTGLRLTNSAELLCDVQETGGHGVGEALGLAGFTNLDNFSYGMSALLVILVLLFNLAARFLGRVAVRRLQGV